MNTQDGAIGQAGHQVHDAFMGYPLHRLVSVFETPEDMQAAVEELIECGYPEDSIEAFCGVDGEKRMDFEGIDHGTWGRLIRSLQHIGPDRTYLERYESHLHDGHCMVMVKVTNPVRKERAARILHSHTRQQVTYFGLLTATEIL
jgi:hypothetical protein